jgi:hypothetical protein
MSSGLRQFWSIACITPRNHLTRAASRTSAGRADHQLRPTLTLLLLPVILDKGGGSLDPGEREGR